jgi:GntR family histidine utilization transcriptional repressor
MTDSLALDGSGPLHEQIRRAVCAPIISGAWPPGHRVPSEHELMALFGAARMTVNRAMRALADDGLIIRRRRTGSVVASAAGDRAVMSMSGIRATVEAGDQTYAYESLARRHARATDDIAGRFKITAGTPLLNLSCRHLADGRPAALEDYWINLAAVPEAGDEPFDMMPPGEWLAARLPWPKSRYVVTALNAGTAMAKLLDLEPGTACLKIDRRSWRDGVPATFVTCLYPGAGHTLTGEVAAP